LKKDYVSVAPYVSQNDGSLSLAPVDDGRDEVIIKPVEFAPVKTDPLI
jgi:hypothetical protein